MSIDKETRQQLVRALSQDETYRKQIERQLYMRDFTSYVKAAWKIIEPGTPYSHNWHIDYLSEELMSMYGDVLKDVFPEADWAKIEETNTRRMCINVPTRSMKTVLVSILFPSWLILHKPSLKVATVSYGQDLSTEINNKRRVLITSDWYQDLFGDIISVGDADTKTHIEFTSKGAMYSTSLGGAFTGKGADLIILDDPQKPVDMGTPSTRQDAIDFFKDTLPTRLNNRSTGVIIVIQQRLHFQDLTGHIMESMQDAYRYIQVPLEFTEDREFVGKITGRRWRVKEGDVLWEERMDKKSVNLLKRELGTQNFEAQQQQNPTPDGGSIIESREWLREYEGSPEQFLNGLYMHDREKYKRLKIYLSWDMNYKVAKDSDYVGLVVAAFDEELEQLYILNARKRRHTFTQTLEDVLFQRDLVARMLPEPLPIFTLIEEKANGMPILQVLDQKVSGVTGIDPGMQDKVARLKSVSGYFKAGDVHIPGKSYTEPWKEELVSDLTKFPYLNHDDTVDALSQLMIELFVNGIKKSTQIFKVYF